MKKLILLCLFIVMIGAVGFAQTKTPQQKADGLKTTLGLSDVQATKVAAIYAAHDARVDSLRKSPDNQSGDYGAMMKKMLPIINTTNSKIMAVLNKDQAEKFQVQVDAQNAAIKKMMDGGQ